MTPEPVKKKILVVDDELNMRIFLCNLLCNRGYEAIDAADCVEGMQKAKAEKPALIILDVMMPKENGIQMYRELNDDEKLKHIPVVMLSTIDRKTFSYYHKFRTVTQEKGFLAPSAYLEKPFEAETLISLVNRMIFSGKGHLADSTGEST